MNKLQRLTWKYFIEQKFNEIGYFLLIIWIILIFLGAFFSLCYGIGLLNDPEFCSMMNGENNCGIGGYFGVGMVELIGGGLVLLLLYTVIIIPIIKWLKSNWRKAKARARRKSK